MDADRQQLKNLILDAERLMATARVEARELVSRGEMQAKELVDAARQLHAAAESEAHTIRSEAAEARAAAERQAQQLLDEAHEKQVAAIEHARSISGSEEHQPPSGAETDARHPDEVALDEASRRVDQMLRVARSEAKASADELMEQARRRAAQIDEDARRREEVAAKQHRAMLLSMRDEQLAIRTRIAELRSELRAAESAAESNEIVELDPSAPHPSGTERSDTQRRNTERREAVSLATEERQRSEPEPAPIRDDIMPMRPLVTQAPNARNQRPPHPATEGETDDDYAKAVKRFRRRA